VTQLSGDGLAFSVWSLKLNSFFRKIQPLTPNFPSLARLASGGKLQGINFLFSIVLSAASNAQTLLPPVITCVSTDGTTGNVKIVWTNPVLDPCGPFIGYILYGATNINGPYLAVDTITNPSQTNFTHSGANATILNWFYYMITVQNCPGSSSVASDTLQDEDLYSPELDYVTVTPGGVVIKWVPSSSSQTLGYIIYYFSGGFASAFDTVYGRTSDIYIDVNANPGAGAISYTIAAFDGCQTVPFNDSAHTTIHLTATVKACLQQVSLNWTPYQYWDGIASYNIETSIDNAPYAVAQSFPDGSYGFDYSTSGITGDTICFRITALRQGDNVPSSSNVVCFGNNQTRPIAFNYLRNVTVNAAGDVALEWYIDTAAGISSYEVKRSSDGNIFTALATLPVAAPVYLNTYSDTTAPTSSASFYYQVVSFDTCQGSLSSGIGRTILLTGSSTGTLNSLQWNTFELDNATVLSYTIYRLENGTLVPDTTLPPSIRSYDDVIATDVSGEGTFCYVVEATFRLDLPVGRETLTSTSNQLCLYQTPVIYVPKAFVPEGKNNYFKPTLLNPNVAEYEFVIFDRWGKKIFGTNLINVGWDGSYNGERLPLGGYAYYVRVVSRGGISQEKKGMVVLVR